MLKNIKLALKSIKDKLIEENKSRAQRNFEKRWELVGFKKPAVHVKQADGTIKEMSMGHAYVNREGKRIEIQVPIYKSKHWSSNKYSTEKLRAIRAKQLKEAIGSQTHTHFTDGTPIVQSQLVDSWV